MSQPVATGGNQNEPESKKGIFFGGINLPEKAATTHFMIVGSTGSGKTLTLQMMMKSVLPALLVEHDQRAVLFDVKQDAYSVLSGIFEEALLAQGNLQEPLRQASGKRIVLSNPFDARCYEWDISKDVNSPEVALQIATTFIPEEQSQNRYFSDAARDLLTGVMNVFIDLKAEWYLADMLYAARSSVRLRHVLEHTDEGKDLVSLHLEGENTTKSVISTLRSKLAPYEVVAALWRHAGRTGRRFSLRAFLKSSQVLVLGNNQAALAAIQAINRVLFQRLTELILDQRESETRRNWFFLDEVRKLGKLEGLDDLMTNGRSKGAAVVLGFQDIDGMRAVYGKEIAGEITSMCGSFGVLRVSGASTPQWAADIFGEQEILQSLGTRTQSHGGTGANFSYGENEQIREKKIYLPSQFRILSRPEPGKVFEGYFSTIFGDSIRYKAKIKPEVMAQRLPKKASSPDFAPWEYLEIDPESAEALEAVNKLKKLPVWATSDYSRLQLRMLPEEETPDSDDQGQQRGNNSRSQGTFVDPNHQFFSADEIAPSNPL